jgi:hypothetical protein
LDEGNLTKKWWDKEQSFERINTSVDFAQHLYLSMIRKKDDRLEIDRGQEKFEKNKENS